MEIGILSLKWGLFANFGQLLTITRVQSMSSNIVIEHTKSVFARHSIPRVVKSGNGPQYTFSEYQKFSECGVSNI